MSDQNPQDEPCTTSQMKRRRIDDEEQQPNLMADEAPDHLVIAAVPNEGIEEPRPQIFKLDVDCVQEMFDWLSIKDIHSVSETCTRMQRIAGDYFQPHLAALEVQYINGQFKTFSGRDMNGFKEFVHMLRIDESVNIEDYRFIGQHCKSLKQITFEQHSQLNEIKIEQIKTILSKIETVVLNCLDVDGEFYERFLQFCPKLKRLRIYLSSCSKYQNVIIGTSNKWLRRSYPALEHLELFIHDAFKIPELGAFLGRNPRLASFSLDDEVFLKNMKMLRKAKIKLPVLAINPDKVDQKMCHHSKKLHDRGFYQRLHLKVEDIDQEAIDKIASLNGLEMLNLYLSKDSPRLNLNSLISLTELGLEGDDDLATFPIDLQSTAKSLVKLERLYFYNILPERIEPFIQYSAKLKAIKLECFNKRENAIDLCALNEKRVKLDGARKVTIYLDEKEFLATKWSNKAIDLKMIEVKRSQSYDWHIPFLFY